MSNRLMISVAAVALIAGAGLANAQGGMKNESGGAATQQSAPSGREGMATGRESGGPSQMQSQSEQKSPGATKGQRAEEQTPGAAKSQRAEENAPGAKSKGMSSENETKGMKEGREGQNNNMKAESREGQNYNRNAETREGEGGRSQMTTGQAGAGAKLSTEQRTKITSVIRNEHVAPANKVNFSIAVGTRVPREGVTLRPLPAEVVTIYPQWRGYEFILVHDQIVVIDPRTDEIVDVLPA
jgi:hypothetical protein